MFWFSYHSNYHYSPLKKRKVIRDKRGMLLFFLFTMTLLSIVLSTGMAQSYSTDGEINTDSVYQQAYTFYFRDNPDDNRSALKGFEQAASGYEQLENWARFSDCLIKQAIIHNKSRNFDRVEKILGIAEDLLVKHIEEEDTLFSDFYYAKGSYLYGVSRFRETIGYLTKASQIRENLGIADNTLSYCYNNLGGCYYYLSDYTKALEGFKQSIDLKEQILSPDDPKLGSSYISYGGILLKLRRNEEATNYTLKGARLYEEKNRTDDVNLGAAYNNLGLIYGQQTDFQKALDYYHL